MWSLQAPSSSPSEKEAQDRVVVDIMLRKGAPWPNPKLKGTGFDPGVFQV